MSGHDGRPTQQDCSLEFFSSSHGKWIPVDVIDMDASGAVQVSAKPGTWISAKDCKRKLRTRVFADASHTSSTITSADAILQRKALTLKAEKTSALSSCEAVVEGCSVITNANDQACTTTDSGARTLAPPHSEVAVGGCSVVSNAKSDQVCAPPVRTSLVSRRLGSGIAGIAGTANLQAPQGYPRRLGSEPVASNREALSEQRPHPSVGTTAPEFDDAVQHCAAKYSQTTWANEKPQVEPPPPTSGRCTRPAAAATSAVPRVVLSQGPTITTKPSDFPSPTEPPRAFFVESQQEQMAPESEPPMVEGVWSVPAVSLRKEAEEHSAFNGDVCGETDSTRSSEGQRCAPAMLIGEAIAYNNRGEPVITRTTGESGNAATVVINEDGTQSTFGKNTLSSLMSSDEGDAQAWIHALTTLEVRGLVHEIGQVLLSTSAIYQFHLNRLKDLSETQNYAYFGLREDATDKEIDMAYRKLAKQMHPDKNGGTPEAKERFQQMKERYEALKQHRLEHGPGKPKEEKEEKEERGDDKDSSGSEKGDGDRDGEDGEEAKEKRKEAYDEDEEEAPKKEESKTSISYDPTDQESLTTTAVEMLQRLRAIEGSMATVRERLRQHGEVVCA